MEINIIQGSINKEKEIMSTIKDTEGDDPFDLNSPLSSQNGKNPFRVDDAYFDAFCAKLNDAITDLEELKEEAPLLTSIPKYNPFEIPTGYFDTLPTTIQQLVAIEKPHVSLKEWLLQIIRPNFAIPVVAVIIIAIAAIRFVNEQVEKPKADLTADLSLEEQLYPIDESLLVDLINTTNAETDLKQADAEENITDYLIENDVDESALHIDANTTTDHEKK